MSKSTTNTKSTLRQLGALALGLTLTASVHAKSTDDTAPQWTSQYWVGSIHSGTKDFWEVDFYKTSAPETASDLVTCTNSKSRPTNAYGAQFYVHRQHPGSATMLALLQDAAAKNARVALRYEEVSGVCWLKTVSVQYLRPKR